MPMPKAFVAPTNSQPFEIKNKTATKAEIILYGSIGQDWFGEGITAKKFSDELKKLDASVNQIDLRINSPGGDVFDGITIYNRLKQHSAKITTYIDGLAASIASIIALAGDEVIMGEGALYMVHLPFTFSIGNRMELDNTINRLVDVEEQMVGIYAKKSKMDRAEVKALLEKETWMDAQQASDNGFVDKTTEETVAIAASLLDRAKWINKMPKMTTDLDLAKEQQLEAKNKISEILKARK
jgi:ATP-dependent Clp protease, protease subunit